MRLLQILKILIVYRLDTLMPSIWWLYPIRFILFFIPSSYGKKAKLPRGEKITNAIEELGVIFIKFGQALSTRKDLLPDDISSQLSRLQDNCMPFANDEAMHIIENSLGKTIAEVFDDFSANPIASASIAQVYTATLKNNEQVVVKVVRPNIEKDIEKDLKLLKKLAKIVDFHPELKRLRPHQIIEEFAMVITTEPDMSAEAVNANILRENFKDNNLLYVPKVYFDLSDTNILVMERIYGTPVADIQTLKSKGLDLKTLAENGTKIFFTQVFKHNFFHADMHPGNIFVGDDGVYRGVDFGIMGRLSDEDMQVNANLFSGFFHRDYGKIAQTFIEAGWVAQDSNAIYLENAMRTICEPMFNKPLGEISFGEVLMNLFAQARKFDAYIQPQFLLFDKTLLAVEGLGRQLYPNLDLWEVAKPLLDEILAEKISVKKTLKEFKEQLPHLPHLTLSTLHTIKNNNRQTASQTQKIITQLQRNQSKQSILILILIAVVIIF
jgi:ubiquinone biosynthesis protein